MVQVTTLNAIVVGLMALLFLFAWNTAARALVDRNPESKLGQAMAATVNV